MVTRAGGRAGGPSTAVRGALSKSFIVQGHLLGEGRLGTTTHSEVHKPAFSVFVFSQAFINKKAYINYIKIVFDSRVSHHVVISSSRGDADSGADAPGG